MVGVTVLEGGGSGVAAVARVVWGRGQGLTFEVDAGD